MGCCFGCFLTDEGRLQKVQNQKIEKIIQNNKRRERTQIKLLLLGTGESGKSTFIRQMHIIYANGYSHDEKLDYIKVILQNILNSMQAMIGAMSSLNIEYKLELNVRSADLIKATDYESFSKFIEMYIQALKELWNDDGIQECYKRRREYQLTDSTKYYLDHIDRIADPLYMPTEEDILRVRVPTTGLVEYNFEVRNVDFRMIDVGGQRSERKKWMHCFDDVKAIIFLVAISEYDQVLLESDQRNRLKESRAVFQSISNYKWFDETSIVMFFNKIDLLKEKIMYSDLASFYPSFQGPKHDYIAARKFIAEMFTQVMPLRRVYEHFTCATDTGNIKLVFNNVRESILIAYINKVELF